MALLRYLRALALLVPFLAIIFIVLGKFYLPPETLSAFTTHINSLPHNLDLDSLRDAVSNLPSSLFSQKPLQHASRRPYTRRILALGDLHGDLPNALKALRIAGVIDNADNWIGPQHADEDVVLVQTGDVIDRGDDTLALFALLDKLRGQAKVRGGEVVTLLGNHEWMNVIGARHACFFCLLFTQYRFPA